MKIKYFYSKESFFPASVLPCLIFPFSRCPREGSCRMAMIRGGLERDVDYPILIPLVGHQGRTQTSRFASLSARAGPAECSASPSPLQTKLLPVPPWYPALLCKAECTHFDFLARDVCTKPANEAQRAEWKHLPRAGWYEWQEAAWHWSPSLHVCQKTIP